MPDFDPNSATPVDSGSSGGGFDPNSATPVGGGAEMTAPENPVDRWTTNHAQAAYDFFNKHGHPDLGQAAYDLIDKGGPHDKTSAVLMGLSAALPFVGSAAEAGSAALEDSAPMIKTTLDYLGKLHAPGLTGAAARVGTATAGGAITGAATGEGAVQGAESGAAMEGLGEGIEATQPALAGARDALQDRQGLLAGANEASDTATEENTATQQKLSGSALKEDAQARKVTQAAIDKQSEANMAARQKQYNEAKTAVKFGDNHADTLQETQDKAAAQADLMAQRAAPAVRDRIIQQATGRTPQQTEAAIHAGPEVSPSGVELPGPDFVARKRNYLDASYGPNTQMQDEMGRQYENALAPFLSNPVEDIAPMSGAVANEEKYANDNAVTYSAPIRKLMADVKGLAPQDTSTLSKLIPAKDLAAMRPEDVARAEAQMAAKKNILYTDADGAIRVIRPQEFEAARKAAEAETLANRPPVSVIRGIRSRAADLATRSVDGHDKAAATAIRSATESALESANVPGVKDINAKYATFKNLFGSDYFHGVAKAKDPIDAAPILFNEPQRAARIVGNATPEQLNTLRSIYGDAVNRGDFKVDYKTQKPVLEKLFPNTKLADPKSWIHLPDKLVKAQDVVADDPEFGNAVQSMVQGEMRKSAQAIIKDLAPEVQKLGPAAQPIMQQLQGAKTPEAQATVLIKALSGMDPEDVVRQLAAQQTTPEQAGAYAAAGVQQVQRSQAANFQGQDPQRAAVQSLQAGKTSAAGGNRLIQMAKGKLPLYGTFTALSLLMGHTPSTWIGGMAALGLGAAMTEGTGAVMKRAFVSSLQNPAVAEAFLAAANNPTAMASKNVLAMGITRMLASAGINALTNDSPSPNPVSPPAAPEPTTTPLPPPPDKVPLPSMRTAYLGAEKDHDDAKMKEIRDIVIKRVKDGEWDKLPPDQRQKLAPWMRTMFGPKSAEAAS